MKPEEAAETIRQIAPAYGEAKAQRVYLDEFRKSKKALLMKDALKLGVEAANAQEREAYADPAYHQLLKGLAMAVEQEETLKWQLEAARLDIEVWRTREATNRMQDRAHQ
jgi:predicted O-linked N-acetylglucosamine transferase (SPINDLY family)